MPADSRRDWHRLFGMSWTDFFVRTSIVVEMEKDLSIKQQWLDTVLVRKGDAALPDPMPDGFEELAAHNLISFKSYQEALDGWTLSELVGHYVNYRKQVSPDMGDLLPEGDFRLFAVSVRYPQGLAQSVPLRAVGEGVYEVDHFTGSVRIVVIHQLPQQVQNAMFLLFSARQELVEYGGRHYRPRSPETSTFLLELFERYRQEGVPMPFTAEEFIQQAMDEVVKKLPIEKRLEGISPEDRLLGLSEEEKDRLLRALQRAKDANPS